MPRLYNWIRGEGTTKAQRWGLNGLGDYTAPPLPSGDLFNVPYGSSGPGDLNYVDPLAASSYASFNQLVGTSTVGSWIQTNGMMLLVGGVALLFLMKRR